VTGPQTPGDWLSCGRVRTLLARLEAELAGSCTAGDTQLRVMALHVIRRGGKRLRPALLMLSSMYGRADETRVLQAAVALELTHVASLYHDDVMDRASARRGDVSANARWGNPQASFAGTYLFSRAAEAWAALGDEANKLAARMSVRLCVGQLREVEYAWNPEMDDDAHLQVLEMKTASLFELPCRIGALLAGAQQLHADALARYGTIGDQVQAQQSLVDATRAAFRLSTVRYEKGIDIYLNVLDAQRGLYIAQQGLILTQLIKLSNQVRLYAVLGGGGE